MCTGVVRTIYGLAKWNLIFIFWMERKVERETTTEKNGNIIIIIQLGKMEGSSVNRGLVSPR